MPEQKTAPQRISQVLLQPFFTLTNCGCSKLLNHFCILSIMYIFQSICLYISSENSVILQGWIYKNLALLLFCNSHKCRLSIWGGDDKWDLKRQGIGPWRRLTDIHVLFTMIMLVWKGETPPKSQKINESSLSQFCQALTGINQLIGTFLKSSNQNWLGFDLELQISNLISNQTRSLPHSKLKWFRKTDYDILKVRKLLLWEQLVVDCCIFTNLGWMNYIGIEFKR